MVRGVTPPANLSRPFHGLANPVARFPAMNCWATIMSSVSRTCQSGGPVPSNELLGYYHVVRFTDLPIRWPGSQQ